MTTIVDMKFYKLSPAAGLLVLLLLVWAGCDSNDASNERPTADFSYSVDGLTVTFTDESTDTDGSIASWNWSFGDGETSDEQNPEHTYAEEGSYTVELAVTDNEGSTSSTSEAVNVGDGGGGGNTVVVSEDIESDETWTAENEYILDGLIFVDPGATLTIEPGTVIKGRTQDNIESGDGASALIVRQDARIEANGEAGNPIIFTSELDDLGDPGDLTYQDRELWGGVIILGNAPTNEPGTPQIEGIPETEGATYGGNDPEDDSGTFRYVSIRHGGFSISGVEGDEINGLTMGGVGRGTTIEYVEVFGNFDDGFEWFGGTVDTRYLVSAFVGDDGFDYDQGFQGRGQHWFSIHATDQAGRGGEHDGGDTDKSAQPYSIPVISNVTYIGAGENSTPGGDGNDYTLKIRDNAGGKYYNSLFVDFPQRAIDIEDLEGDAEDSRRRLEEGDLVIENNLFSAYGAGDTFADLVRGDFAVDPIAEGNSIADPVLDGVSREANGGLDPRPTADEATSGAMSLDDGWFDATDYLGAFDPDGESWLMGWTFLDEGGFLQ